MTLLSTHICTDEDACLLGCDTVLLAKLFPGISKDHSAFMCRIKHLELLDPEDEGTMIIWNTANYLSINTASHPRWFASTAVLV
jgi:hypothetical protein